ncbi:MAG: RDD family protein [Ruminococcaceae bacterium]|nr:RDD family protein [Oscillospiraceae bacterium]
MTYELRKATVWKRASAYICDLIVLLMAAVGIALALSAILGYDKYDKKMDELYNKYATEYGIDLEITDEEFETLPQEQKDAYAAADKALQEDKEVIHTYNMMSSLLLLITSLSALIAYVVFEFIVPLLFKNGQTLGKKVFGVAVMRTNSVRVSPVVMFVRAILGKYTIETMVPILFCIMLLTGSVGLAGFVAIIGMLILQLGLIIFTKNRTTIHDLLSDCVVVDMASQMIFDSEEAIIEYQKRIHAEAVQKDTY